MKTFIFLLLPVLLPAHGAALELLLEANRGESGSIGYVDIDRVFKEYSGTGGAREEFILEIKKKESEAAAIKSGVFAIKAEISKLRQEREFALTLPSLFETRKSVENAAAAGAEPTESQPTQPSTAAVAAVTPKEQAVETINMPGVGQVPLSHFKFSVSTSVPEIDAVIERKEKELKLTEDQLRAFQRQAERELLEYESHKTEILLGRIYIALKELAVKEAVSVVVDKRNVLFGQSAVDLTEKLLNRLESEGL